MAEELEDDFHADWSQSEKELYEKNKLRNPEIPVVMRDCNCTEGEARRILLERNSKQLQQEVAPIISEVKEIKTLLDNPSFRSAKELLDTLKKDKIKIADLELDKSLLTDELSKKNEADAKLLMETRAEIKVLRSLSENLALENELRREQEELFKVKTAEFDKKVSDFNAKVEKHKKKRKGYVKKISEVSKNEFEGN